MDNKKRKIKIGLALGAGGLKGYAELGIIKVLEEAHVKFDCISGASIGSIVGAMLADGYTVDDIQRKAKEINIFNVIKFVLLNRNIDQLKSILLTLFSQDKKIEKLNKKFFAMATELSTGKEFSIENGSLINALLASSAYPIAFKPVYIKNVLCFDGMFANSVPSNKLREYGADYIIGIDLSSHKSKISKIEQFLYPHINWNINVRHWLKGYYNVDMMLKPDLSNYTAMSINQIQDMYNIGYECGKQNIDRILNEINFMKKSFNLSD